MDTGADDDVPKESAGEPPWLRATMADFQQVDFETPIANSATSDCRDLSDLFLVAVRPPGDSAQLADTPALRVFTMLAAITGMHLKPDERLDPFGPSLVWADGRRSAIPSDFRGRVDILAEMAGRATNPVLRARLADLSWLLDRKRGSLAVAAISAYADAVRKVSRRELGHQFVEADGVLDHNARDYLSRALQIGRAAGWDKAETIAARELLVGLRQKAIEESALVPIRWFSDLDLKFAVSDPAQVGAELEVALAGLPSEADPHLIVDLWRLAAQAYHQAKRSSDKARCQAEAAERLVKHAEAVRASPMLASHFLAAALAQLHGVPDKKERRLELRHQLVDLQARIPEDMTEFAQELDLGEFARRTEQAVRGISLLDQLFAFAALGASPDPNRLESDAAEMIRRHPLSSIFGTSHHDREGKVIYRTDGGDFGDGSDHTALRQQIAQSESIRRKIFVSGVIEVARRTIVNEHYLSDDVFTSLLEQSPFVPHSHVGTFSRGFARFFQGDFVSAIYILTPILENSLRHVLKINGHDVSTFNDTAQTQEDRTISSLFDQMRGELDGIFGRAITTDIDSVFLSKRGPHLRHALAHGLLHDGDPYGADAIYGCWLVFRLCLLPLSRHRGQVVGLA